MKIARILIRCDASNELGFGHLRRCLNLAQWLRGKFEILFCMRKTKEAYDILTKSDFEVQYLAKDISLADEVDEIRKLCYAWKPKIVISDILATSAEYMQMLSDCKARTINFDDTGAGAAKADVLIDANRRENKKKLFGPRFAVLHALYAKKTKEPRTIQKQVKKILIAIGGGDPHHYTQKLLECLEQIERPFSYAVVIGQTFKDVAQLKQKWKQCDHICFLEHLPTLTTPLLWADCAIVNGGLTMFESLCMGTPTVVISQNPAEMKNVKRLERKNVVIDGGLGGKLSVNKLHKRLKKICDDVEYRKKLSATGKEVVDGKGLFRVIGIIEKYARKK